MRFKSNIRLLKLTVFLQEKYPMYFFNPDTYLNLIEIITIENAEKDIDQTKNLLIVSDSKVKLGYVEKNKIILEIKKQANEFMKESE